ncbi:DUF5958 family protein [Spirosoma lituiforme]
MSLEEELSIHQFGQGALSEAGILDSFAQLNASQQRKRFVRLYFYVAGLKLLASDVDQAMVDCFLTTENPINKYLNLSYLRIGSKGVIYTPCMEEPPGGDLVEPYKVLLYVFKANYQRRYSTEKDNPTKWWYRDFSNPETAQAILDTDKQLAEAIYANVSFRSEFVTMAKLWHTYQLYQQASTSTASAGPTTNVKFVSYAQIERAPAWTAAYDTMQACATLRRSVEKALARQYGLDSDEAQRLTLAVIDRHMQETYSHGFHDE